MFPSREEISSNKKGFFYFNQPSCVPRRRKSGEDKSLTVFDGISTCGELNKKRFSLLTF